MTIKIGIQHGTNSSILGLTGIQDLVKSARLADKLGYSSSFLMDHLTFFPRSNPIPGCFTTLGHFSAITSNVLLGPLVTEPHRIHPAQMALEMATLQQLSNGRGVLCIGAGEAMNLDYFGVQWDKPVSKLIEAVKIIKLLWSSHPKNNQIDFEGKFFKLKKAFLQLEKNFRPPPIWIGANSPKTIEITGEIADGWIPICCTPKTYRKRMDLLKKSGRVDELETCYELFLAVNKKNPSQARSLMKMVGANLVSTNEEILVREYNINPPEGYKFKHLQLTQEELAEQAVLQKELIKKIPEKAIFDTVGAGTPDDIISLMERFVKAGVKHFILEIFGNYWESLKLIAEEIIPCFKDT